MRGRLLRWKRMGILTVFLTLLLAARAVGGASIDAGSQWKYILVDDGVCVDGYGEEPCGDLIIPGELDGYPVTAIGDSAFERLNITSVTIPDSVQRIGDYAFFECSRLTEITIPASVIRMGWNPFARCASKSIRVSSENPVYADANGVLFDKEQKMLVAYPDEKSGKYVVPKGTLRIGESAFEWSAYITGCSIPGSVTDIGARAFYMCQSLASVTISKGVTLIGDQAFFDCRKLKKLSIPGSVTSIGESAFFGCGRLKTVIMEKGVVQIGDYAFESCTELNKVTIPDSVTSIGQGAFFGCESLKKVSIPQSVTSIGQDAFDNFHGDLTLSVKQGSYAEQYAKENGISYLFPSSKAPVVERTGKYRTDVGGQWKFTLENGQAEITGYVKKLGGDLVIPSELDGYPVTALGEDLFYECKDLVSVMIPDGVKYVGPGAFSSCINLTSVTIPDGVTSISDGLLQYCRGLTSVALPDSVTSIGSWAFTNSGLTGLTIPDGVTSIGFAAFSYCKNLTSVAVPGSVTSIGDSAFASSGLTSMIIPDGVTSIGERTFYNCSSLTSIAIPSSVTSIGEDAFYRCKALALSVTEGSFAERYAQDNDIPYVFAAE